MLDVGGRHGAACRRVEGAELEAEYPTVAAVGRGSERKPVVASFTWQGSGAGEDAKRIALCGKGVCFDTGGYDLKPAAGMLRMKKDMGGAALMLAMASGSWSSTCPSGSPCGSAASRTWCRGRHAAARRAADAARPDGRGRQHRCGGAPRAVRPHGRGLGRGARPDAGRGDPDRGGAGGAGARSARPVHADDDVAAGLLAVGQEQDDPMWRLPLYAGYDSWLASPVAISTMCPASPSPARSSQRCSSNGSLRPARAGHISIHMRGTIRAGLGGRRGARPSVFGRLLHTLNH